MLTNTLTTEPVRKLFFRYLIPSICGTMVTSIYVLADTIIIGKGIGIDAMAALNIILPLFNIFFGTGLLFGVGGSVLMSIARGKGDTQTGNCYFSVAVLLNAITCILYIFKCHGTDRTFSWRNRCNNALCTQLRAVRDLGTWLFCILHFSTNLCKK